jgi:two-component system phosphate regulon sensor histidine kinase PhoR
VIVDEHEKDWAYKQALMLTLSNSAYDALLVLDRDCRIIAINNTAEELFGQDHLLGRALIEVTGESELQAMVQNAIAYQEETFEEQITLQTRRHFRCRVQVIQREGYLFVGVALQDVSELVRLNRARRDMVANISHELRTPIANIRLIIDSLFHEDDKPKRKRSISSLQAIARETDSLLWIMQEMLDLSMIESGQAIVRMVDVNLHALTEDAIERLEEQAIAKEVRITHDVPPDMQVLCDYDQIRRVLVNLIHNAIKWSPKGGRITIHASNGGDDVTIEVLDDGPGVPSDQVERIFERFYQVNPSRSGSQGTGLGLAICKHIVEAHGGRIWAVGNDSQPAGRFYFTVASGESDISS